MTYKKIFFLVAGIGNSDRSDGRNSEGHEDRLASTTNLISYAVAGTSQATVNALYGKDCEEVDVIAEAISESAGVGKFESGHVGGLDDDNARVRQIAFFGFLKYVLQRYRSRQYLQDVIVLVFPVEALASLQVFKGVTLQPGDAYQLSLSLDFDESVIAEMAFGDQATAKGIDVDALELEHEFKAYDDEEDPVEVAA
ncbi:MAG TPA: hypothetical protein VGE62_00100 [Candidatus Paceibacterota bacterium]